MEAINRRGWCDSEAAYRYIGEQGKWNCPVDSVSEATQRLMLRHPTGSRNMYVQQWPIQ